MEIDSNKLKNMQANYLYINDDGNWNIKEWNDYLSFSRDSYAIIKFNSYIAFERFVNGNKKDYLLKKRFVKDLAINSNEKKILLTKSKEKSKEFFLAFKLIFTDTQRFFISNKDEYSSLFENSGKVKFCIFDTKEEAEDFLYKDMELIFLDDVKKEDIKDVEAGYLFFNRYEDCSNLNRYRQGMNYD